MVVNNLYFPHLQGGAEISTQVMCEELARIGHEVSVYSLTESSKAFCNNINGVTVNYVPISNVYWPFGSTSKSIVKKLAFFLFDSFNVKIASYFEEEMRRVRPDVLHTSNLYGFSPAIWKAAKKLSVPVVHTLRDYYLVCKNSKMFRFGKNCEKQCGSCLAYSLPRKILSKNVAAVVGVSQHILDTHILRGVFSEKTIIRVIHNPYVPSTSRELPIRDDSDGSFTFGFIGRVAPEKGILQLIEAFGMLGRSNIKLLIAGEYEEEYKDKLVRRCSEVGGAAVGQKVKFLGKTNAADFYECIHALVMPSLWHEPFGRGVVEAYSFGIPVIAASRGGLPEIVLDSNFACFNPNDIKSILASMNWVLNKKHDADSIRAYASAFDVKRLVVDLQNVYGEISSFGRKI